MTSRDFCYWLQGYFEIAGPGLTVTATQVEMIQLHLSLVFKHEIDPSMGDADAQKKLNELHDSVEKLKHKTNGFGPARC